MKPSLWAGLCVGIIGGFLVCVPARAQQETNQPVEVKTAELLSYARIYIGEDNETHLDDVKVSFDYKAYDKDIPKVWVSQNELMNAKSLHLMSMPAGWDGRNWDPTPARQFIIPLSGEMELQASDGKTRTFAPGDILLVENTKGKGHASRMVSSSLGVFAVIPMPK